LAWVADYSFSRPNLDALKASGCTGIVRYAADVPGFPGKQVEAAEIAACAQLGLTLTIVQEGDAQPALRGFAGGVADATSANNRLSTLGYDTGGWIYYAAEDPNRLPQTAWPTVVQYFQGVNSVRARPVGGYGSAALLDHLESLGLISRKWAVAPWGGYSSCHLAQYGATVPAQFTGQIDANLVIQPDYGQTPRPNQGQPPLQSGATEMGMYSYCLGLDGTRKDVVWVAPDGVVWHGWSAKGDLAHLDATENLGGQAQSVTCSWDKAGKFTVVAHGTDNHPYIKMSDGTHWVLDWTGISTVSLHAAQVQGPPGNAGPPGPPGSPGPKGDKGDTGAAAGVPAVLAAISQKLQQA
jgi:hypothetical protein